MTLAGGPFGACIVKDNKVIALTRNTVLSQDATCHAEVNAIRQASKKLNTFDLSGCVIYSTTEPCPMCFSACHWAKVSRIVFGAGIKDARDFGFNELTVSCLKMKQLGDSYIKVCAGVLAEENRKLFSLWKSGPCSRVY